MTAYKLLQNTIVFRALITVYENGSHQYLLTRMVRCPTTIDCVTFAWKRSTCRC